MTREEYKKAESIVHDLDVLKSIQVTQKANHWVDFVCAEMPKDNLRVYTDMVIGDFKEFVVNEIKKLESELEKL